MIRACGFILTLLVLLFGMPDTGHAQTEEAPVTAQPSLPALYGVAGVEETDMLNVRLGPSTDFEIVTKLSPSATAIEVVEFDDSGEWGLIALPEGRGWAAMRYLVRAPGQAEAGLPNTLSCVGTEPFWSFNLAADRSATFSQPDSNVALKNVLVVPSQNRNDRHALFADGGEVVITSLVGRGSCSDGMSDRPFGLSIDLLVTSKAAVTVYSGCCSVAP